MDGHIHKLLERSVIEEKNRPYSALVLVVRKSDKTYCLVTNLQKLNVKGIQDNFKLSNMTELIDNLSGEEFFPSLDLTSGYFQIPSW